MIDPGQDVGSVVGNSKGNICPACRVKCCVLVCVCENDTGLKPESGKLRQPGVGETPPWTSNLLFPSLLQHDWMTKKKKKICLIYLHKEQENNCSALNFRSST